MITANFDAYASYTVDSLYQWDTDVDLMITGLSLLETPDIHFTNAFMGGAIMRECEATGSIYTVRIPNSLLQYPADILAHVFYKGKTVETIRIPLIERARPIDYQLLGDDDELYSFNELRKHINASNEDITLSIEEIKQATADGIKSVKAEADKVTEVFTDVKKSVSDGKKLVAEAITLKGVTTAEDAEFSVMATNISLIGSAKVLDIFFKSDEMLPFSLSWGCAVVFRGDIHILGGTANTTKHYKYSNGTWSSVSTLPYAFANGCAVVLNDELHILGGADSTLGKKHYKYDGSSWTACANLSEPLINGSALVINDEIYVFGAGTDGTKAYVISADGVRRELTSIPYDFTYGSVVYSDDVIHLLGGNDAGSGCTYHYVYENDTWTKLGDLPYVFYKGSAIEVNEKIRLYGGYNNHQKHYEYDKDNDTWNKLTDLHSGSFGSCVVEWNKCVLTIGHNASTVAKDCEIVSIIACE